MKYPMLNKDAQEIFDKAYSLCKDSYDVRSIMILAALSNPKLAHTIIQTPSHKWQRKNIIDNLNLAYKQWYEDFQHNIHHFCHLQPEVIKALAHKQGILPFQIRHSLERVVLHVSHEIRDAMAAGKLNPKGLTVTLPAYISQQLQAGFLKHDNFSALNKSIRQYATSAPIAGYPDLSPYFVLRVSQYIAGPAASKVEQFKRQQIEQQQHAIQMLKSIFSFLISFSWPKAKNLSNFKFNQKIYALPSHFLPIAVMFKQVKEQKLNPISSIKAVQALLTTYKKNTQSFSELERSFLGSFDSKGNLRVDAPTPRFKTTP